MELKGSRTEKNLHEAFAGESMARNKYTTGRARLEKKDTNKLPRFLKRRPTMKKSMPSFGSKHYRKVAISEPHQLI